MRQDDVGNHANRKLLTYAKEMESLLNADTRKSNADLRRFSSEYLRPSACNLRESALKYFPSLICRPIDTR